MLDYKGIEALHTVLEEQSFEEAAKKLFITQSAVSQRIKGLESYYGEPVLVRQLPYRPTKLGKQLLGHFKQLCLLEEDLKKQLGEKNILPHLTIAINRDSLETWFQEIIEEKGLFENLILEVIAEDQELTLEHLKNGTASACLSTSEKEVVGGNVSFLGDMEYILAASPTFVKKYFSKGTPKQCFSAAPAIKFDQNDKLHERFLEKCFGFNGSHLNYYTIPSVRGFKKFALMGYGYGLIPRMDIMQELKKKQLVQIYPEKTWKMPLYWHYWSVQSKFYQKFNDDMIHAIKNKIE